MDVQKTSLVHIKIKEISWVNIFFRYPHKIVTQLIYFIKFENKILLQPKLPKGWLHAGRLIHFGVLVTLLVGTIPIGDVVSLSLFQDINL